MSLTHQLRKGMVIRHEGHLFTVVDYATSQSGKQKATVHVKLRALRDGHASERTLDQLGTIEEVPAETRTMQFLYSTGSERVFMDTESFEQYPLGADVLGDSVDFLVEEETYRVLTVDGQPVSLQLPAAIALEVVDTAPVEHAGGSSNIMKEARLRCGITVRVPLFIKNGDKIRITTADRQYQSKES